MKRIVCLILALTAVFLAGCGAAPVRRGSEREDREPVTEKTDRVREVLTAQRWIGAEETWIDFDEEPDGTCGEGEDRYLLHWTVLDGGDIRLSVLVEDIEVFFLLKLKKAPEGWILVCEQDGAWLIPASEAGKLLPEPEEEPEETAPEAEPEPEISGPGREEALAYLTAVERLAADRLCYELRGFLFDLDGDGAEELVLWYGLRASEHSVPVFAYDVYAVEAGQLTVKAQAVKIDAGFAGGSKGRIGIDWYEGEPVLLTYSRTGTSDVGYHVYDARYEVRCHDPETMAVVRTLRVDVEDLPGYYTVRYEIDGVDATEEDFRREVQRYRRLSLGAYEDYDYLDWNEAGDEDCERLLSAYDLIRLLQKTGGVVPEQAPVFSPEEAMAMAKEIWADYLQRQQGFDWAVFREESIVRDGKEFYCFTLRSNSSYGAEDWTVAQHLFVDSVLGLHSDTLW